VAAAAALADEEADDADGIDRVLDPNPLMPGGIFRGDAADRFPVKPCPFMV
jgi:hypothetical protein